MVRNTKVVAAVAAAALVGAGAGAGIWDATAGGTHTVTTQAAAASPVANVTSNSLSVNQIYQQSVDGVVEVDATSGGGSGNGQTFPFGNGGPRESTAQGTGFVYDDSGHILTNEHVVSGASSVKVNFHDGSSYTATVVGSDPSTDVAVLKVNVPSSKLHPVTLGDSGSVAVGDGVVAIGNPFGLDDTVTSGIVSAVGREIQAPNSAAIEGAIQTDAAINHGNSGGPLFDLQGKVIGITAQIESDSGGNDGVGFAIPSNLVKTIAGELIANGKVEHPLLGVQVTTLPATAATQLGEAAGVAITSVQSGSGAAKAGLQAATGHAIVGGQSYPTGGDVITAVDGKTVKSSDQLRAAIAAHKPGDTIQLQVSHGSATRSVKATLGSTS
jgi:putative serine protease PepD